MINLWVTTFISALKFSTFWMTNILATRYQTIALHEQPLSSVKDLGKTLRQSFTKNSLCSKINFGAILHGGWSSHNVRSGPILAVLIHSLWRLPLKLGLIQTLSLLCSLRPDFSRNADWLLEQCHKIWLAVGNAGSWKRLFLAWLCSWMTRRRRREGSILLSFSLFYILSGFALFTELMWVYRGVESLR